MIQLEHRSDKRRGNMVIHELDTNCSTLVLRVSKWMDEWMSVLWPEHKTVSNSKWITDNLFRFRALRKYHIQMVTYHKDSCERWNIFAVDSKGTNCDGPCLWDIDWSRLPETKKIDEKTRNKKLNANVLTNASILNVTSNATFEEATTSIATIHAVVLAKRGEEELRDKQINQSVPIGK